MKYTSNNSNVATVDNTGLIRGISPGITTITCKSQKDTSKQTQVQIIVRAFTDTVKTFNMKIGNTLQLSPTISDSDTSKIIYSNLTSNIIDVSESGLVTAKMMGTGRVLVREENSGAQIEYTINVLDSTPPVISVSPTSSSSVKNTNITIKVTDNKGELNSSNSYQYQLSTSKTTAPTGTWINYTNGTAFTIGQNLTGTYYLWVKQVSDKDNNISQSGGTKVGNYHVFGAYKFDNTAPTCTITANKTSPTNASSITYTFTWNEEVTGFALGDISVTNGTKGTFSTITANKVYSLVVTNNGSCTQTVYVIPPGITDLAGNAINAVVSKSITIDRTSPTVSFGTNGKTYTIPSGTTTTISSKVTVSDTGGASVNTTKYAWSTSNSTTPTSWTSFTNGGTISKSSVAIGSTYYLWIQATDKIGNTLTTKSNAFTVIEARWKNTTSNAYYNTLASAVSGSATETTIQLLKSYTDTTSVSVSKNLTITLEGYTLTKTTSNIVINSGYTVTVNGRGTITGQVSNLFYNSGTLNFSPSSTLNITNNNNNLVYNKGALNINSYCNISCSNTTIYQYSGTFTINSSTSTVKSSGGNVLRVVGGTCNLNSGNIISTGTGETICSTAGTVNVQGATVSKTTSPNNAIYNYANGTVNIKSGTVTSNQSNATVTNYATITMSGGNVINTCSSGGCLALASSGSSTISGGRIYVTSSRSSIATSGGHTYNLYQHGGGTMNITGGTIGNESYNSTTVIGNYGLVIQGGTVNMTGGRINIASNSTYPGRGVAIDANSTFNLSSTSSTSYAQVTAWSTFANAGAYNIGVELHASTAKFNLSGYAKIYAIYNNGTGSYYSGYSIYKNAGTYSKSGSPTIYGSTYGI